jgi:hypothetical protein
MGHVLSGWDGTNPLEAPTNLCEFSEDHGTLRPTNRLSNFHYSLPDVRGSSSFSLALTFIFIASVDRFAPHVIASALC